MNSIFTKPVIGFYSARDISALRAEFTASLNGVSERLNKNKLGAEAKEKIFRKELEDTKLKADQATQESRASRVDIRRLSLNKARNLILRYLYDHLGFETDHAGSPPTFFSTYLGIASWRGKEVPGAKDKITILAQFYLDFLRSIGVHSRGNVRSVVCLWDKIKEYRNLDQHEIDLPTKITEMIDFYARHIALKDELQPEDLEVYNFFRAVQEFKISGSTFPVASATSTPATAGYTPFEGGTSRPKLSYAQAAKK